MFQYDYISKGDDWGLLCVCDISMTYEDWRLVN